MKVDEFIAELIAQVRSGVARAGVDEPAGIELELTVASDADGSPPRMACPGDGDSCSLVSFEVKLGDADDDFGVDGDF